MELELVSKFIPFTSINFYFYYNSESYLLPQIKFDSNSETAMEFKKHFQFNSKWPTMVGNEQVLREKCHQNVPQIQHKGAENAPAQLS